MDENTQRALIGLTTGNTQKVKLDLADTPTRKGVYITVWRGMTVNTYFVGEDLENHQPIVEFVGP